MKRKEKNTNIEKNANLTNEITKRREQMEKQTMFLISYEYGNVYHKNPDACLKVEVSKGRKYYTATNGRKFTREDFQDENGSVYHPEANDGTPDYLAYLSEEEARQELERRTILKELLKTFRLPELNLEQLQEIKQLISKKQEKEKNRL